MDMKKHEINDEELFEIYKLAFEEVHASDELKRKVENMADNKKRIRTSGLKRVAAVAIIATLAFATGNVATYAATGNNLIKLITVKINGKESDDLHLEKKTDEKGNTYYEGSYDKDGNKLDVWMSDEAVDGDYSYSTKVELEGEGEDAGTVEIEIGDHK